MIYEQCIGLLIYGLETCKKPMNYWGVNITLHFDLAVLQIQNYNDVSLSAR